MAYGRPSDASPKGWYEAAKNVDQNQATNKAFKLAYQAPTPAPRPMSNPTRPTPLRSFRIPPLIIPSNPTPGNPVPMDIDDNQRKAVIIPSYYKCGGPGHKAPDCPLRFNIQLWTTEELEMELMTRKDLAKTESQSEENSELVEGFVQDSK